MFCKNIFPHVGLVLASKIHGKALLDQMPYPLSYCILYICYNVIRKFAAIFDFDFKLSHKFKLRTVITHFYNKP